MRGQVEAGASDGGKFQVQEPWPPGFGRKHMGFRVRKLGLKPSSATCQLRDLLNLSDLQFPLL